MGHGLTWSDLEKGYLLDAIDEVRPKINETDRHRWTEVSTVLTQKMIQAYPSSDPSRMSRKGSSCRTKFLQMKRKTNTKKYPSGETKVDPFLEDASKLAKVLEDHHRSLSDLDCSSEASSEQSKSGNDQIACTQSCDDQNIAVVVDATLPDGSEPEQSGRTSRVDDEDALAVVHADALLQEGEGNDAERVVHATTVAKNNPIQPSQSAVMNKTAVREENVSQRVDDKYCDVISEDSEPEPDERIARRLKQKKKAATSTKPNAKKKKLGTIHKVKSKTQGIAGSTTFKDLVTDNSRVREKEMSTNQILAIMMKAEADRVAKNDLVREERREERERERKHELEMFNRKLEADERRRQEDEKKRREDEKKRREEDKLWMAMLMGFKNQIPGANTTTVEE